MPYICGNLDNRSNSVTAFKPRHYRETPKGCQAVKLRSSGNASEAAEKRAGYESEYLKRLDLNEKKQAAIGCKPGADLCDHGNKMTPGDGHRSGRPPNRT